MRIHSLVVAAFGLASLLLSTGCASIMSGTSQNVVVRSTPEGAKATFLDKAGKPVSVQTTPCTVSLKRSGQYVLKLEKENFKPLEAPLTRTINGWYMGNIFFGGLLGLLIVDPATGAMFSITPDTIETELAVSGSDKISMVLNATPPKAFAGGTTSSKAPFPGNNPFNK
jgi:hypothetical protein